MLETITNPTPNKTPEKYDPHQASERAHKFIRSLGKTPEEIAAKLKRDYPIKQYTYPYYPNPKKDPQYESVSYISSHPRNKTKGKPTVVFLCGVFEEVRQRPLDLATIANVFDVQTVAVDYAALAGKAKGINNLFEELPKMLEGLEADLHAKRILVGESLGGLVAQSILFSGSPETRVGGYALSHTIPPQLLNKNLYRFLKGVTYIAPFVPMSLARRVIDKIVQGAHSKSVIMGEVTETDKQLQEVGRIESRENGALTRTRGRGYAEVAVGAVEKSANGHNGHVPGGVIVNKQDSVLGCFDEDVWGKVHNNIHVITLDDPAGHFTSGVNKEEFLADKFIPLLAEVLSKAE
ncbi:MAG TPA: alpha/beta hydrolase [Patescibacteria group bacterium]